MADPDAGYSGTPQAKKLGLKPGMRVALIGRPDGWSFDDPPEHLETGRDSSSSGASSTELDGSYASGAAGAIRSTTVSEVPGRPSFWRRPTILYMSLYFVAKSSSISGVNASIVATP